MSKTNFMYLIGIVSYLSWIFHLMFNPNPYEEAVLNEGWIYLIIAIPVYFTCVYFYGWRKGEYTEDPEVLADQSPTVE
ncbi:hypothetical protein [Halobacillus sp. Marseille-Q1614]|uniref:hypothetical protein n=1 Tax=Halobacillus sp. Marseille-Q1614 TaxID=2709134 RepID=UPI00156F3496|nr:hypothetical protein [Halobacillus sp. Marseille-Q1614]